LIHVLPAGRACTGPALLTVALVDIEQWRLAASATAS
jgi:hypothetical protein